ncbi:unnamed protein product [Lepeophtheirus salmonis]|uniref:(salmon louse) hypothetical protein n=1 Tax=Lepeophtheirus salmonis TaxID=72036 RepID=A0A7R8H3V3_LEPSM|nr:unnamed protein product [Lepeophtheirus salmonis]CAF2837667.1 unnamed protein product [Lepeophtheirus salmonis]
MIWESPSFPTIPKDLISGIQLSLHYFKGMPTPWWISPFHHPQPLSFYQQRLLVTCETDLQLHRIMESRSISEKDSQSMLSSSPKLSMKIHASHTIENSSSFTDTKSQVLYLHESTFAPLGSKRKMMTMGGILLVFAAFFLM